MSMKESKNNKKIWLMPIVLVGLIIIMAGIYIANKPTAVAGAKALTIEVVDQEGTTTAYEVHTDAEFLRQAMEETEGLSFEGTESEYGMMVETVNGTTADYAADGAYWAFYVNGEYCNYGIDSQPVVDGEVYTIEYTVAE